MRLILSCAAVLCLATFAQVVAAAPNNRFLVPGNDGYGVADCLAEGAQCGQAVADSYCEAQGFRDGALGYGRADADVTASTGQAQSKPRPRAFEIECRV